MNTASVLLALAVPLSCRRFCSVTIVAHTLIDTHTARVVEYPRTAGEGLGVFHDVTEPTLFDITDKKIFPCNGDTK